MAVVNSINNLQQNVGVINSGRFTPQQNVGDVNKSTRVAGQSQDNLVNLATSKAQYEDHQNDMFAHQRNVALQAYIAYGRQGAEAIDGAHAVTTTADDITDTSAGFASRETHRNTTWQQARFEVSTHLWTDFSEADGGIAVINEGKYGLGVQEDGFSVSLLRSNIRPDILSDIGHHDFCLTILPHSGNAVEAGINRRAIEYNTPLIRTEKALSASWDFGPLYLEAAKLSEDGKKIVYRLSEQDGMRGRLDLGRKVETLNMLEDHEGWTESIEYKPFEIITIAEDLDA